MRSRSSVNKKIITLDELREKSERLRSAVKRVVATNGCFDILHVGHVRYLAAARKLGDVLVVMPPLAIELSLLDWLGDVLYNSVKMISDG